ncbi:hypothetical protein WA158_004308 [Blastocystis sp. Blastoise]
MNSETNSKVLRPDLKIQLNQLEKDLFKILLDANDASNCKSTLRVAGGWVRDKILGKESHDIDIAIDNMTGYDFAVNISPYLLEHGGDPSHLGRIKANPEKSKHLETTRLMIYGTWIDLVNLRAEQYTNHSRIPTITIGTPREDAFRRDLTINALFYNINLEVVEDFTELGVLDLFNNYIRTPLEPLITFLDDPLRILRCVRFAGRFGFKVDDAIFNQGNDRRVRDALKEKVSDERKGLEIYTAFNYPYPSAYICMKYLYQLKLLQVVLPAYQNISIPLDKKFSQLSPDYFNEKKCLYKFYEESELIPIYKDKNVNLDSDEPGRIEKLEYIHNLQSCFPAVIDVMKPYKDYSSIYEDCHMYMSMASFFSVFSYMFIPANSGTVPLITAYLRDQLKYKTLFSGNITLITHLAPLFSQFFMNDIFPKTDVGDYIFTLKELWPIVAEFSLYDYLYINKDNVNTSEVVSKFILFIQNIQESSLQQIWTLPPPVNGSELVSLGFKRGPMLKYPVRFIKIWMIENPHGTSDQCKAALKEYLREHHEYGK